MSDRTKPGVALWATGVLVVVFLGYPLSFGPACWVHHATGMGSSTIPVVYRPIVQIARPQWGHPSFSRSRWNPIIVWYARLGIVGDEWPNGGQDDFGWVIFRGSTTW